jgi:hypothetical protein
MLTVDIRASPAVRKSLPDSVIPERWDMCYASRRLAAQGIQSPTNPAKTPVPPLHAEISDPANKYTSGGDGKWYGYCPCSVFFPPSKAHSALAALSGK